MKLISYNDKYCDEHKVEVEREMKQTKKQNSKKHNKKYDMYSRDRRSKDFYNSNAWKLTRDIVLARDSGLCQHCIKENKVVMADAVHHIVHLKDDWSKGFDRDNLISLCNSCHNKIHRKENV